jgi:hypothetical protein
LNSSNKGFASIIAKVAEENEKFMEEKAKEPFSEVLGLVNDVIEYVRPYAYLVIEKEEKTLKEYATRPMLFFMLHILMPFSYGLFTDLLLGNLPACFYELRVMLESIAKCYLAELYSEEKENVFFEYKLLSLEEEEINENDEKRACTSRFLKEFGDIIGLGDEPSKLWKKISKNWIHTTGIASKIVKQAEISKPPSHALILPINYREADLNIINELGRHISSFRKILKTTMEKYKKERITS